MRPRRYGNEDKSHRLRVKIVIAPSNMPSSSGVTWAFRQKEHEMNNSRSRKIRRLMAETGPNYTKAALEMDRRQASADAGLATSSDDLTGDRFRLATLLDAMDQAAMLAGLPSQEQFDKLQSVALAGLPSPEQLDKF
jgi:hypothetical protein